MNYPKGIFEIIDHEENRQFAEYVGRQDGFECLVCGKGKKCFTFNIYPANSKEEAQRAREAGKYETWGFGPAHINKIKVVSEVPYFIWLRVGVSVYGSKDEINKIASGDEQALLRLLRKPGSAFFDGNTYIPEFEMNKIGKSNIQEMEIDFTPILPDGHTFTSENNKST